MKSSKSAIIALGVLATTQAAQAQIKPNNFCFFDDKRYSEGSLICQVIPGDVNRIGKKYPYRCELNETTKRMYWRAITNIEC